MKCNVRELAHMSDQPCVLEGRLNYKKVSNGGYLNQNVFKERWFRLVNNYLFYFKISEMGKFDTKNPAGVFVMENSSIQMEHGQNIPFAFSISFIDESERRHLFAARTEDNVVQWVMKLRTCSYEYLRGRLHNLQSKIYSITGKDPLLMVPRNQGAMLWAPAIPYSTVPACAVSNTSFSCHLHTNGAFTLERSKSDVQAHRHLRNQCNKTMFYMDSDIDKIQAQSETGNSLERSKTSILSQQHNHFNDKIFDKRPLYSRAAPSPPVRKKLSPSLRRAEIPQEIKQFSELTQIGILDSAPVPPRRKVSPKMLGLSQLNNEINSFTNSNNVPTKPSDEEDLIKF